MAKNLRLGLQSFLKHKQFPSKISVLSIGCGSNSEVIFDEIKSITDVLVKQVIKVDYTGIDLRLEKSVISEVTAHLKLSPIPASCQLLQLDANNLKFLEENNLTTFDIIILRHPQFWDSFEQTSKQLLRQAIPALLIKDGFLVLSLYADVERMFFEDTLQRPVLDVVMLSVQYTNKQYLENDAKNATRIHEISGIEGFDDHHMYCYQNVISTKSHPIAHYTMDLTGQSEPHRVEKYIVECVTKLGGKINPDRTFHLWKEYAEGLIHHLHLPIAACSPSTRIKSDLLTEQGFFSKLSLSTSGTDVAQKIISKINTLKPDNADELAIFQTLVRTISDKKYNQALRQACSVKSKIAHSVIDILLEHGPQLDIKPQEENSKKLSALTYAEQNEDPAVLNTLEAYVRSMDLSVSKLVLSQKFL